eukprot:CAMPEP_0197662314 /NCGR_PEP_ID=MMETSP1338-20131121/52910_1 /TAXON_ID=43686 ORGANISM="Pelagodinium beii, Strain RCC1491" /NCGR_SAMPLE_ID=MMETSP1338 /ASSEMBLY_ACC=CAM_ASM_000754 /LENGTH=72 /DNA_ID=CAMNT_0043240105 /DNA_START=134 /DNA_END=352 /DNA_ORIENTATION=+
MEPCSSSAECCQKGEGCCGDHGQMQCLADPVPGSKTNACSCVCGDDFMITNSGNVDDLTEKALQGDESSFVV